MELVKNDVRVMSTIADGFTCSRCRTWVPNGVFHQCPVYSSAPVHTVPTVPTTSPPSTFGPCLGLTSHDFVVTNKHAICNRCEKVVKFESRFMKRWRKLLERVLNVKRPCDTLKNL